jgi:hypothetical protein
MATYNLSTGSDGYFQKTSTELTVLSKTVDFAKFTGSAAGVDGDIATIISIPSNFQVQSVSVAIGTASTTSGATITVEDAAGTDYVTGFDVTQAAKTTTTAGTPKFYVDATTVQVLLGPSTGNAPANGIVTVYVTGFSC